MSIESVERVKAAEIKAGAAKKTADEKAAEIISDAKIEANRIIEKAEVDADVRHDEIIAKATERAETIYREKIQKEHDNCSIIKAIGREHIDKAIEAVVRKVVSPDGNC